MSIGDLSRDARRSQMTLGSLSREARQSQAPRQATAGGGWLSSLKDYGISAARGVASVPEAAIGLSDLTPPAIIGRYVSEKITGKRQPTAGEALEGVGFSPRGVKDALSQHYSPKALEEQRRLGEADGVWEKAKVAVTNPHLIGRSVVESAPLMVAGGGLGRAAGLAGRVSPALAGAGGEAAVSAGAAAEQIRQETGGLTPIQAATAGTIGAATGALGLLGGRIANAMGVDDIDTVLAVGMSSPKATKKLAETVVLGALSEGVLEELPQSVVEQVLSNQATGKDLMAGVDEAAVMGTLAGAAMGGGMQGVRAAAGPGAGADAAVDPLPPDGADAVAVAPAPPETIETPAEAAPQPQETWNLEGLEPEGEVDTSFDVEALERPEIGTVSGPAKDETGKGVRVPEVEVGDVTNDEADELQRIVEEMEAIPFTPRATRPDMEADEQAMARAPGAPVYHDIVGQPDAKGNPPFRYTRDQVIGKLRQFMEAGKRSVVSDLAMDVARKRLTGDRGVSRPSLPPEMIQYEPPEVRGDMSPAAAMVTQAAEAPDTETVEAPKLGASTLAALDGYEEQIRARLRERGFRASAGIPADAMADVVALGAVKVAKGAVQFAQWSDEMVREFGEAVRPHLRAIWEQAKAQSGSVVEDRLKAAPTFYSELERTVEAKVPARAAPKQVENIISKGGIPKEEVEWSGLKEWLADRKGPVTRDEVLEFLRANRLELKEVSLGDDGRREAVRAEMQSILEEVNRRTPPPDDERYGDGGAARRRAAHPDLARRYAALAAEGRALVLDESKPKYGEYVLPGEKSSYREVLLGLPARDVGEMVAELNELGKAIDTEELNQLRYPKSDERHKAAAKREAELIEKKRQLEIDIDKTRGSQFLGAHFAQPNVVAHMRLTDRVDDGGRKVLLVEEVQSDWHQEGRKKGYAGAVDRALFQRALDEHEAFHAEMRAKYIEPGGSSAYYEKLTPDERDKLESLNSIINKGVSDSYGVPDAPFKTTWPELVMKRALRYAAEGGYDAIAWTTGEQQAERFDLSKQISEVHYSGTNLKAYDHSGSVVIDRTGVSRDQLPDYIGKEAAEKLLAQEPKGTLRSLVGQDLKVGGEGMKAFYDKMLPSFMKKYVKQWSGRVGETSVNGQTVHAVDVTPDMRRSVVHGGQSQFGRKAAQIKDLLSRVESDAKARIKERGTFSGGRLAAGLPVEDMADLTLIGAAKVAKGALTFAEWSGEMLREFGAGIRPHLQAIWEASKARAKQLETVEEDDYFNFDRVQVSDAEKQALRQAVTETVIRTGRNPKEKESWEEIQAAARELHPDLEKHLRPFQEEQPKYRAVRFAARERINALNRKIEERRKAIQDIPEERRIIAEREVAQMEQDRRGLLDTFMRMRSEDGRNLAMHAMMARSTWDPESGFDDVYWMSQARRSMGLPSGVDLPPKVWDKLNDLLQRGREVARSGEDPKQIQFELSFMMKDLDKTGFLESLALIRKAGLLTGLKTHARNIGGNTAFQIMEELSRLPAVMVDGAMSSLTGKRTVHGVSARAVGQSARHAATKGVQDALEIWRNGQTTEQLLKVGARREMNSGVKWLDRYVNGVFRTLGATDALFKSYAYRRSMEEQAKLMAVNTGQSAAELLANPTEQMMAEAIAAADFATFNNPNVAATMWQGAKAAGRRSALGEWAPFAMDIVVPYTNTPANILARILDYSPIGASVKGGAAAKRMIAAAMAKEAMSPEDQRAFSLALGRGLVGTPLMYLGWHLAAQGLAVGLGYGGPGEEAVEGLAGRMEGSIMIPPHIAKKYGIEPLGGKWHLVAPFSPLGNLVAIGATMYETRHGDLADESKRVGKMLGAAASVVMEQPMLKGARETIDALKNPGSSGERLMSSTAGSFVPTLVSDAASLYDPYRRDARVDSSGSIWAGVKSRLPGLRNTLPERMNVLGRLETQDKHVVWNPFISPAARELDDKVIQQLVAHDVGVAFPMRRPGESAEDYRTRTRVTGKAIDSVLQRVVNHDRFDRLTDEQKKDVLEYAVTKAKRAVRTPKPEDLTEEQQERVRAAMMAREVQLDRQLAGMR